MKKRFSPNGAFPKKTMIVGVALAVVVALSYFGSSNYLEQSIMDMLMGGTTGCSYCSRTICKGGSCECNGEGGNCPCVSDPSNCACDPCEYPPSGWGCSSSGGVCTKNPPS